MAYGIGGKYKWESEGESDDKNYYDDDDNKKFNTGLAFGVGMTFGHIFVGMNYDLGLTNILKDGDDGSLKNKCLSFNIGYNF